MEDIKQRSDKGDKATVSI